MEVYIAIEFGQVSQVVHKHELHRLTMTRTLSKAILSIFAFRHVGYYMYTGIF